MPLKSNAMFNLNTFIIKLLINWDNPNIPAVYKWLGTINILTAKQNRKDPIIDFDKSFKFQLNNLYSFFILSPQMHNNYSTLKIFVNSFYKIFK